MLENVLAAVGLMGGLGLLFGVGLVISGRRLKVEEDPRLAAVASCLPGANCGACGFSGCNLFAQALLKGTAGVGGCRAGGDTVAQRLGRVLGVKVGHAARRVARVRCGGDAQAALARAEYNGVLDCRAADMVAGGPKGCPSGCLGLGSCVKACPFDAIHIGERGLPEVDEARCTGCGLCELVCPRNVIQVMDSSASYVQCVSPLPGKAVRQVCQVGCIGCRICERVCEYDAIHVVDNLAVIDPERCTACGKCAEKCPTGCIVITKAAVPEGVPAAVPVTTATAARARGPEAR